MRSSWQITPGVGGEFQELLAFDRQEIDNPNLHDRVRLQYLSRIYKVIGIIKKQFPLPKRIAVGEFGCNQANTGLLLAEADYRVIAVDINPLALRYSREKYEKGSIEWLPANLETFDFPQQSLDAIILGENLTLFAQPERLLASMTQYLRPSGLLIVTIPNGEMMGWRLPTLKEMRAQKRDQELLAKQFGNAHLFKLALRELIEMRPPSTRVLEASYCGGSIFFNKYSQWLLNLIPVRTLETLLELLARTPIANKKTLTTLSVVFQMDAVL